MEPILALEHVNFKVEQQVILQDISLTVPQGSFITLAGPSGSGKSTILKICARLLTPTSGKIIYQGQNITSIQPNEYRRHVSYCFQQPVLFGETVRDNLDFPYQIRNQEPNEQRQKKLLNQVNLGQDYLDKNISSLSGGERQRVALIRNLIFVPEILLLDEITTGLDTANKEIVHRLINSYRKQGTILAVTHDTEELKNAEQIVHVERGRVK